MEFKKFNEIAELVGIVAIVASLIFVGLELRQSHSIAKAEVMANYLANSTEKNSAIIAEPDIWARGNAGEELTPAEQAVFEFQVLNEQDRAWFAVEQYKLIGYNEWLEAETAEMAMFLHKNPGARRVWLAREDERAKYFSVALNTDGNIDDWGQQVKSYLEVYDSQIGDSSMDTE